MISYSLKTTAAKFEPPVRDWRGGGSRIHAVSWEKADIIQAEDDVIALQECTHRRSSVGLLGVSPVSVKRCEQLQFSGNEEAGMSDLMTEKAAESPIRAENLSIEKQNGRSGGGNLTDIYFCDNQPSNYQLMQDGDW